MVRSSSGFAKSRRAALWFRPGVEVLEQRALMTAGAIMQGSTLVVKGTSGDDVIVVAPTATPGQVDVTINAIEYGTFTPASATISGLDGSDNIVIAATGIPTTVIGGSGNDRLTGPDVNGQVWNITGKDAGSVGAIQFSGIERLKGGIFNDIFRFAPGGSISDRIEGNGTTGNSGNADTLDYSLLSTPITVDNNLKTASHIGGTFLGIEYVVGSASSKDKLINDNYLTTISGTNSGYASNYPNTGSGYLGYSGIENLASTGPEIYRFFGGSLSGKITAGTGSTLDYKYCGQDGVTVNLSKGTASLIAGGISGISNVDGTSGNDLLIGNAENNDLFGDDGNDILVGGGGNDTLDGGSGQDIVIGGAGNDIIDASEGQTTAATGDDIVIGGGGKDTLVGGTGNDILIAGTAAVYDPTLHSNAIAKLQLILAEWTRTDLGYHARITDLMNGGGLNGNNKLNSSTINVDGGASTLTGGPGNDWFIIGKKDTVTDPNVPNTEVITSL